MNPEQNTGSDSHKHIAMELTAEGVRVTNISLDGSRLIVTIEAELADSQFQASTPPNQEALKTALIAAAENAGLDLAKPAAPAPAPAPTPPPAKPAPAKPAPGLGAPISEKDLMPAPAAPKAAPAPAPKPAPTPAPAPAPAKPQAQPAPTLTPQAPAAPAPAMGPSGRVGEAATPPNAPQPQQVPAAGGQAPKITETWDPSTLEFAPPPASKKPAPPPAAPAPAPTPGEISLGDLSVKQDWGGLSVGAPAAPEAPSPQAEEWNAGGLSLGAPGNPPEPLAMSEESSAIGGERHGEPQPAISFGLDSAPPAPPPGTPEPGISLDTPGSIPFGFADAPAAPQTPPAPPPPAPGPSLSLDAVGPAPLSLGSPDPQPAFDFDVPPEKPSPAQPRAPGPSLSLGPDTREGAASITLGPMDDSPTLDMGLGGLGFGGVDNNATISMNSPAAGPAISLGDDNAPAIGFDGPAGFGAPPPASPAPAPAHGGAASISLGDDDGGLSLGSPDRGAPGIAFETTDPGPGMGFSAPPPAAAPAPIGLEPAPQQPSFTEDDTVNQEAPTLPNFPPPKETPPPAPQGGSPMQNKSAAKNEAGGTTVLIRYTCPKCKTQGMQAVDKVGTVVNCSNCGKAMRLVMRK